MKAANFILCITIMCVFVVFASMFAQAWSIERYFGQLVLGLSCLMLAMIAAVSAAMTYEWPE